MFEPPLPVRPRCHLHCRTTAWLHLPPETAVDLQFDELSGRTRQHSRFDMYSTSRQRILATFVLRLPGAMSVVRLRADNMGTCLASNSRPVSIARAPVEAMACHRSCSSAAQPIQQPALTSAWAHCDGRPFASTRRDRGRRRRSVVQSSATLAEPRTFQTSAPGAEQQPLQQRSRSRESRFVLCPVQCCNHCPECVSGSAVLLHAMHSASRASRPCPSWQISHLNKGEAFAS